jgi:hypothetical protein
MTESYEQQTKDSEMIIKQISSANYDSWEEAQRAVVMLYVPDMTISRSGISLALNKIERSFKAMEAKE